MSWPSPIARERLDELVAAEAAVDHASDRVRLLGRDDPGDPRADRRARRVATPRVDRAVQRAGAPRRDDDAGGLGPPRLRRRRSGGAVARDPGAQPSASVAPFSRYVLYQTWRVLTDPPQDFPLAICDWRTVTSADIVPLEYHVGTDGSDVTYRSQGSRYSDRHEWWYFPDLTRRRPAPLRRVRLRAPRLPQLAARVVRGSDGARSGAAGEHRDPVLRPVRLTRPARVRTRRTRRSRRGSARPGSPHASGAVPGTSSTPALGEVRAGAVEVAHPEHRRSDAFAVRLQVLLQRPVAVRRHELEHRTADLEPHSRPRRSCRARTS